VAKQFGKDSIVDDSNEDGLELLFKMEGTDIHLYLLFVNNLEAVKKTQLPFGRTAYARSISQFLDPVYDELEEQAKKRIKVDDTKCKSLLTLH
jgi:predicted ribonuclease YlaK